MIDFANPILLYLLIVVALLGLLFWWAQTSRRRKLRRFGREDVITSLMPDASIYKPRVKVVLRMIALIAIVIVLARPRFGDKESQTSRVEGIEIMIAFDVSNSMLASSTDNPDGISRLDRARLILEKLIDKLHNDKVGLVIFAAEAKTQLPLTTDYYSAKMYLSDLSPKLITYQGTSITDAINLSVQSFSDNEDVHKAIILITDAENHEGDAVEAAKMAAEKGIQVDVIGVGSAKGAPIPLGRGEYMRDREGKTVITAFNDQIAKDIAEAGHGAYINGASAKALDTLVDALDSLDKSEFKKVEYKASAEQFPTFAWLALIFLLIDTFVLDRKSGWLKNVNFFTKES